MHSSGQLTSINSVAGVFGQFVERSGSVFGSLGTKIRGLVAPSQKPARVSQQDPETLAARAIQSARIRLRLLAQDGKWDDIVQIAETTEDDEIAAVAILELVSGDSFVEALERMAAGETRAALRSIIALINNGCAEKAMTIFAARMKNGDYVRLVQSGLANPFSILDIMGLIEDEGALPYFEELWQSLSQVPERQYKLMGQILGDTDPLGCRYRFEGNLVSAPVKLKALELTNQFVPADRERSLWFATRDEDDYLAYHATVQLATHWQSDEGRVPYGLEPFALLDLKLLHYLCQLSASFQWSEPSGAGEVYEQYKLDRERLEALDPEQDSLQYQATIKRLENSEDQIKRITERRVNSLQPLLNQISKALNLPNAMLSATDRDCCAAYVIGTGCIEVNRAILMEDKPLSEELMSSILHELGHMEQDVLVIRKIADDLGLIFGQHSRLLLPLYERYAAGIGYAPQSMFLMAVLRLRNDVPLSPKQRQRAVRLHEAAYMTAVYASKAKTVADRLGRIATSSHSLTAGLYDLQLLSCLNNQRGLNSLFQRGEVPLVLLHEISRCKQDLEDLIASVYGAKRPRKNIVEIAQHLYKSPTHTALVAPIIERLKAVLSQVLEQEYKTLDKTLTELKRAGYHEAEAYTISDRVEVLVKALRKGWLEA